MKPGQPVESPVTPIRTGSSKGKVHSLQAGPGRGLVWLPPENAVGNIHIKVVQRVPVKIVFDELLPADLDIAPGMSVVPKVKIKMSDTASSPAAGWQPRANPWLIALAVMLATFMVILDTSIARWWRCPYICWKSWRDAG